MVTLLNARPGVLEKIKAIQPQLAGDRVTSGSGSTTTAQINRLGHFPDNSFVDTHWLILPQGYDGASTLEFGRVSAFDQDDGSGNTVVTISEPVSGTIASGVTAYLSSVHPDDVRQALNSAGPLLFPYLAVPRRYHHVNQSHVFNGFFDFWDTLPVWWARSNASLAITRDKHSWFGESSAKLVNSSGAEAYMNTQPVNHNLLHRLVGEKITLHAYMWCDSATSLGIRIRDGSGALATVYHTGGATWEQVDTAEATLVAGTPTNPLQWEVVEADTATGYVSAVWTTGGPKQEILPIPPSFRRGPSNVEMTHSDWPTFSVDTDEKGFELEQHYPTYDSAGNITTGRLIKFTNPTSSNRLMYVKGEDYLTQASLETDVYEVDPPQTDLLYIAAIVDLKQRLSQSLGSGSADLARELKVDWERTLKSLLDNPANSATHPSVTLNPMFSGPGYRRTPERYSVR